MRKDIFLKNIEEIVRLFVKEKFDCEELENDFNIDDEIWNDKETFGEIAYNVIVEYIGDEFLQNIAELEYKELKEEEEREEEEE